MPCKNNERIEICSEENVTKLENFIDNYWKKNHILSCNRKLLDFQHKYNKDYNFLISFKEDERINAILGFIPTYQFDENLSAYNDVWLAIWKVDETHSKPGIGFALLKWIEKNINPQSIGAIGINNNVLRLYRALGYSTGVLNQYYIVNPKITDFKICSGCRINKNKLIDNSSNLKLIDLSEVDDIPMPVSYRPRKSIEYLRNRYERHPYYKYFFMGAFNENKLQAIFVIRKIEVNKSFCMRIVDIIGAYEKILYLADDFYKLLIKNNAEYIDCLNFGLPEKLFNTWGFIFKDKTTIVPNYFEPFSKENIDIIFAYKSKDSNYIIFKGDSDQDRPNIL